MTTATLPKTITIIGRRWFQKTYGNTYHSAQIVVDGKEVEGIYFAYGYGDQYLHNAFRKLQALNLIPSVESSESPWYWAQQNGVSLTYTVTDVQRKKDL